MFLIPFQSYLKALDKTNIKKKNSSDSDLVFK